MFGVLTTVCRHATSISHGSGADARITQSAKCRSFNSFRVWPIFIDSIENAVDAATTAEWTVSLFQMNRDLCIKNAVPFSHTSAESGSCKWFILNEIDSFLFLFSPKRIERWALNITQQFVCVGAFAQQMFRSPRFSSQRTLFTHEWTNKFAISVGIPSIQFGVLSMLVVNEMNKMCFGENVALEMTACRTIVWYFPHRVTSTTHSLAHTQKRI